MGVLPPLGLSAGLFQLLPQASVHAPALPPRSRAQWDVLSDGEACEVVAKQLRPDGGAAPAPPLPSARLATAAAEALVQLALMKGTMDNVTAVVALLEWA